MKRGYLKIVRKTYRFLRHPRLKKYKWFRRLVDKAVSREYWKPEKTRVAKALSIGLFCSMIPFGQSILAFVAAIFSRANLPIALTSVWITNPITQPPTFYYQDKIGDWVIKTTHCPIPDYIAQVKFTLPLLNEEFSLASFSIGIIITAIGAGLLAFPIVYGIAAVLPKKAAETQN